MTSLGTLEDSELALARAQESLAFLEGHVSMNEAVRRLRLAPLELASIEQKLQNERSDNELLRRELEAKQSEIIDLRNRIATLEQDVGIDSLTAVANRRAFDEALSREWRRCSRARQSIALAFIDLDKLKEINDEHGHGAGDAALRALAQQLMRIVRRAGEIIARYGGDEFAAILPGLNIEEASALLAVTLKALRTTSLRLGDTQVPIRASIGISAIEPHGAVVDEYGLIKAADEACLLAKRSGRDRAFAAIINADALSFGEVSLTP